jgi:hypothetical protein
MAYAAVLLTLVSWACAREHGPANVPAADLLRAFDHAERRPRDGTFDLKEHTFGGVARASLVVPAESRIIWTLFVPHRGRLQTYVALPPEATASVAIRVGMSDRRIYNTLAERTVTAADVRASGWIRLDVDLSNYAGRQWSLFYRPDDIKWQIIVGTHVLSGSVANVYLGMPVMVTDVEGAREYLGRLTRGRT